MAQSAVVRWYRKQKGLKKVACTYAIEGNGFATLLSTLEDAVSWHRSLRDANEPHELTKHCHVPLPPRSQGRWSRKLVSCRRSLVRTKGAKCTRMKPDAMPSPFGADVLLGPPLEAAPRSPSRPRHPLLRGRKKI